MHNQRAVTVPGIRRFTVLFLLALAEQQVAGPVAMAVAALLERRLVAVQAVVAEAGRRLVLVVLAETVASTVLVVVAAGHR